MPIVGTCTEMCPHEEHVMRSRTKRLHFIERHSQQSVKEYARCAAGSTRSPKELRTPDALVKTTHFLVSLLNFEHHDNNLLATTNFITDRLRAVRQDIIIQQLPPHFGISIIQQIVRYHILVQYLLHQQPPTSFDPVLNDQLLRSYLSDLMEYYQLLPIEENLKHQVDEFKSYQLLLNIHDQAFIQRLLIDFFEESSSVLRLKEPSCRFQTVFSLYLSWSSGNFYRFFKKCHGLSFLESCCLLEHFTTIRVHFLDVLSAGFQSKHFKFNLEKMQDWFCFDNEKDLYEFLKHFNLPFDENNKQVNFQQKKTFQLESRSDRFDLIRKCTYIKLIENSRELESKNYTQVILPT